MENKPFHGNKVLLVSAASWKGQWGRKSRSWRQHTACPAREVQGAHAGSLACSERLDTARSSHTSPRQSLQGSFHCFCLAMFRFKVAPIFWPLTSLNPIAFYLSFHLFYFLNSHLWIQKHQEIKEVHLSYIFPTEKLVFFFQFMSIAKSFGHSLILMVFTGFPRISQH